MVDPKLLFRDSSRHRPLPPNSLSLSLPVFRVPFPLSPPTPQTKPPYLGELDEGRQLRQDLGRHHRRVDRRRGQLALQRLDDRLGDLDADVVLRLGGRRAQVRRADDVGPLGERVVRRRGLLLEHVEGRGRDDSGVQGFHQGVVVDDAAARDVDDAGSLLHLGEGGVAEEAFRLRGHGHVEGEEVA